MPWKMPSTDEAANYRPEKCAYCGAITWCELRFSPDRKKSKWQCRACKVERFFERMLYAPLGYRLLDWTRKALRDLYGTVDQDTGLRRYRRAYISVGKQNGKSFLTGGLPIYHIIAEKERDAEAFGAAAARDQAGIVFKAAETLVNANPELLKRLRVVPSTKRIVDRAGPGYYAVVSAEGRLQDGKRPSLLIRDEIHRWKTTAAETLRDVLTKGQISRREPLDIQITTAGAEYECELWWNEYQFAKQVQADPSIAPDYYSLIFEADSKRVETEPEYWKSREARVAANPSHEDLGGHLTDKAIVAEMNKAIVQPSERPKYLRYHLNVPLKTSEEPALDLFMWQDGPGDVDLRKWPVYDTDLLIRKWGLMEKPCWCGVDASWTTDLTAAVLVFPPVDDSEEWSILAKFWMAKDRIPERERRDRQPYGDWARRGFLETTEGNVIDTRAIQKFILWAREMFELRQLDYDRTNFNEAAQKLQDDNGIDCKIIGQDIQTLSEPTKKMIELYLTRKLRHGNNPVMNFCAASLSLKYDDKDGVKPIKPNRLKANKRIDGIAAMVNALRAAIDAEGVGGSEFYKGGLLVL
jgi:phage terminase large subunit-like protein